MSPSVADIIAFQSLPEETRALVIRLVGGDPTGPSSGFASSDLEKAFRAGWDACADDYTPPGYDARDFRRWQEAQHAPR